MGSPHHPPKPSPGASAACVPSTTALRHTLIGTHNPPPSQLLDYERSYEFWAETWRATFAEVDAKAVPHSDPFLRQREISTVFDGDSVAGMMMYDWRDLRLRAHREMSFFQDYPDAALARLLAEGHGQVMLMGQLAVHPAWRRSRVGPLMADTLVGLCVRRFLASKASVMVAVTRNDRGTQRLGYRFGAKPLAVGHVAHGIGADAIAFYRDCVHDSDEPAIAELVERLWNGNGAACELSPAPAALMVSPSNDESGVVRTERPHGSQ